MLKNKNILFQRDHILNFRSSLVNISPITSINNNKTINNFLNKKNFNFYLKTNQNQINKFKNLNIKSNNINPANKNIQYSFNSKMNFSTFTDTDTDTNLKKGLNYYKEIFRQSICEIDRHKFWEEESQEISWFKKPNKILDDTNKPFYKWFPDGEINMTYNCVDRHIENGNGDSLAFIWESAYLNKIKKFSYSQIDEEIKKICKIFIGNNLKKGDRVVIYMPMIPEALFSMLACAKLGLVHCVVFGGFAADELANRINHCEPKMIVTASASIEPKSKIPYLPIIKESFIHVKNPGIYFI